MPGQLLHRIALRLCRDESDRVLEPLIADLQREWTDTKPGRARTLALTRAYFSFWRSAAACGTRTIVRGTISPIDREMTRSGTRVFAAALLWVISLRIVGALLGITGLRMFGNSWGYWHRPPTTIALGELMTMGWSVVFAMLPTFMYLRRDPRRRWDATASRVLVGGLVVSIALVGWVGPSLFGASVHAQGYFLDGHAQPAFASLTTVIRMARDRSSDMTWLVMLHQRLAMIVTALLLSL